MRTSIEALFDAMITDGWFTASDGNVEAPTGHFAYVTNTEAEVTSIVDAFADTIETYGMPDIADIVGSFVVVTDSLGNIGINRFGSDTEALKVYREIAAEYAEYLDDSED